MDACEQCSTDADPNRRSRRTQNRFKVFHRHPTTHPRPAAILPALGLIGLFTIGCSPTPPTTVPPLADEPGPTPEAAQELYPGVTIDRAQNHVDLAATVIGREFEWLELLATRPGFREHESIVTLDADAKHIQLALILLGLEPGQPARTRVDPDTEEVTFFPPHGPALELFFILPGQPDVPIPANHWVADQQTGEPMPGNDWRFTGSTVIEFKGQRYFMAEKNGTVVSLVNFGDDLVSRPTDQSDAGGNVFWTTNLHADPPIPPAGTRVTLRIRPAKR